eukprot:6174683-Pleurochrysis_carterae.AAC.5
MHQDLRELMRSLLCDRVTVEGCSSNDNFCYYLDDVLRNNRSFSEFFAGQQTCARMCLPVFRSTCVHFASYGAHCSSTLSQHTLSRVVKAAPGYPADALFAVNPIVIVSGIGERTQEQQDDHGPERVWWAHSPTVAKPVRLIESNKRAMISIGSEGEGHARARRCVVLTRVRFLCAQTRSPVRRWQRS